MSLSKFNLVKLQNHRGKFLFQNITVNLLINTFIRPTVCTFRSLQDPGMDPYNETTSSI